MAHTLVRVLMMMPMNILIAHNYYQLSGGEDLCVAAERNLLEAHNHRVFGYTRRNDEVRGISRLALLSSTLWGQMSRRTVCNIVQDHAVEVTHFHNTFPLISPAAYYGAREAGAAVAQTLHNYRLLCPNALFFRDGQVCEDCLGKAVPWPSLIHRCYRHSLGATVTTAAMLSIHHALRTWTEKVDVYIALTEFARDKFVQGGLPADRILVKPNFLMHDPGCGDGRGQYALFVGRLSPEKGLDTLLAAWDRLGRNVPLKVVGDGPLAPRVAEAASRLTGVEYLGSLPKQDVLSLMKRALFLAFSSLCYEGFPNVIVEAYASGLPVLASNIGSMSSLIEHGRTGLHFRPGDPDDLARQVEWGLAHPREMTRMRREARAEYLSKYTAERNYEMLMEIYRRALENRHR